MWTSDFGDGGGDEPTISPAVERLLMLPINELTPTLAERYID